MQTRFRNDTAKNDAIRAILSRWPLLKIPQPWLVAGCLFQTVWNVLSGRPPGEGIKDYDLFYFDSSDLSAGAEAQVQRHVDSVLGDLGVFVEVANQARVHTWYTEYFGQPYSALYAAEEGVDRFLVLESCVGIRPNAVYSPYGVEGIYAGTLTPNPLTPHRELFDKKVETYRERWKWLNVQTPLQRHIALRPHAAT
jgi:uncharacterized protein